MPYPDPSLPYILLIVGGGKKRDGFMTFPKALAWRDMQTA